MDRSDKDKRGPGRGVTLKDDQITSRPLPTRRAALMAFGTLAFTAAGAQRAAAADNDSGTIVDRSNCPRGAGGVHTGLTDADSGNIRDASGYGRWPRRC